MSATALVWVLVYVFCTLAAFINPLFGMLGYLHEYYNRPELQWWGGDLPRLRWNLIISVVFGLAFLLRRGSLRQMVDVKNLALPWLLGLNIVMIVVGIAFAVSQVLTLDWVSQWMKLALIFPLLTIGVLRSREAFNAFVAANMAGTFWWGYNAWRDPHREAGRLQKVGSGDTRDDNSAASHLLTVLPFAVVYALTEKDKRLRLLALMAAPFIVNTIILCNSRGSIVGAAMALAFGLVLIRPGYRARLGVIGIATALVFVLLADQQFWNRQQTTATHEDGSSQQRLETWQAGWGLIKQHPFGTGGRGFHLLSPKYIPSIVEAHNDQLRAPHNTYVMIASEWGVIGFICYVGYVASVFRMLHRIKARAKGTDFFYWRAYAIQLGFIAYLVAQTFSDRLYAEAGYWLAALSFALYRIQATELAEQEQQRPTEAAGELTLTSAAPRLVGATSAA